MGTYGSLRRWTFAMLGVLLFFAACGGGGSSTSPSATTPTTTLAPLWTRAGIGDMVFDMPSYVTRVRVVGTYTGYTSNFIIWINKPRTLLVNELLGTGWGKTTYDGTLLTGGGGVVSIESSSGVVWSFAEVR